MAGTQAPPPNPNGGTGQNGPGGFTQNNNVTVTVTVTNDASRKNLDEPGIKRELQAMHMPPGIQGA